MLRISSEKDFNTSNMCSMFGSYPCLCMLSVHVLSVVPYSLRMSEAKNMCLSSTDVRSGCPLQPSGRFDMSPFLTPD